MLQNAILVKDFIGCTFHKDTNIVAKPGLNLQPSDLAELLHQRELILA